MHSFFRTLITAFLLPLVAAAGGAMFAFQVAAKRHLDRVGRDQVEWFRDAVSLFEQRYVEDVRPEQLAYDAIRGMAQSRDRYSDFIDPPSYARFQEENEGKYVGVGFVVHAAGPPVTVNHAFPGSPAARAGLEPGDRVVAVDGRDCTGADHARVIEETIKRTDSEGLSVTLTVEPWHPAGAPRPLLREVVLRRERIERPSVFDAGMLEPAAGIAYVRLADFHERCAEQLAREVLGLHRAGMRALVLDLRRNRGGVLDEAVAVASLFLDQGVVVRTRGRSPDSSQDYPVLELPEKFLDVPLALLVDQGSASASEVVAGALLDHRRAFLVGTQTFGKGMVQSLIPQRFLVEGRERIGVLKITTSEYLTPDGRHIERDQGQGADETQGGLDPHLVVELPRDDLARLAEWFSWREIPQETRMQVEERLGRPPIDDFADLQRDAAVDLLAGRRALVNELRDS